MQKKAIAIFLMLAATTALSGCTAIPKQQPFFNHYMGQSEQAVIAAEGAPDEREADDSLAGGHGLSYQHKSFMGRDFKVYFDLTADDAVALINVTDSQPETAPPLQFAQWGDINLIGKSIDEVLATLGPPQLYAYSMPLPNMPPDGIFGVQGEFMDYQHAFIGDVACNVTYTLHNGRVEAVSYHLRQPLPYAEYVPHMLAAEKALTAFFDDPVWLRRQAERPREHDGVTHWGLMRCMADERYAAFVGGRVKVGGQSALFMALLYDRQAQNAQSQREISEIAGQRIHEYWNDPDYEHGGDFAKAPAPPPAKEE